MIVELMDPLLNLVHEPFAVLGRDLMPDVLDLVLQLREHPRLEGLQLVEFLVELALLTLQLLLLPGKLLVSFADALAAGDFAEAGRLMLDRCGMSRTREGLDKAIATIGIKPDYPATGYGYIEQGETVETGIFLR